MFLRSLYFQYDPDRLSTCPLTVHALLHIAASIKFAGPVWCYWAFPMERFCGSIQPGIRSRRFPWASMDRYVSELAQLTQIKTAYGVGDVLSLRDPPAEIRGSFSDPLCMCSSFHLSKIIITPSNFQIHLVYCFRQNPKLV